MRVFISETEAEAQKKASSKLASLLTHHQDSPILLLLSGGTAIKILNKSLASKLNEKTTLSILDERYTTDPSINNFAQLKSTTFYQCAQRRGVHEISTLPQRNESMKDLEKQFERSLRIWIEKNRNGKIIATFGIGKDTHTAGIMPFPEDKHLFENLFNGEKWVASYNAGAKNEHKNRITTTLTFLRIINSGVVFVIGEDKKIALKTVINNKTDIYKHPARILNQIRNTFLFTDQQV